MSRVLFLALSLSLLSFKLFAQTIEPSSGIDKKTLQIELESLYSVEKIESQKNTSWNIPNILIRYGLTENIELQLLTPFTKERCFENNELQSNVFKFEEIEIGLSLNLWKQNGFIPETALMVRLVLSSNKLSFDKLGNIISLNFSNNITKKLSLNYNIGTKTNLNKETTGFYVVNIGFEPNSKVHFFIENSSDFTFENSNSNCLGTGFGINLNKKFAVDFSVAKSLKHKMFYAGAIITWVINSK